MEKKRPDDSWVSSREIMERQGISRGTLNNYIKAGLLSRPVVRGAREDMKGTKKIGYFPPETLERMDRIRSLKENGKSMDEIIAILSAGAFPSGGEERKKPPEPRKAQTPRAETRQGEADRTEKPGVGRHPGEDIPHPAYYINHSFRIQWLNSRFKSYFTDQATPWTAPEAGRGDSFPGLLGESWKNRWIESDAILDAHFSMMKTAFHGERLSAFLNSRAGDAIGRKIERVKAHERQFVLTMPLTLEKITGGEELFHLHGLCLREGILFVWEPVTREGLKGEDRPVPAGAAGEKVREEKGEFIVLTAKMEGMARLCAELPSREYGALAAGVGDLAKETIRRQGGIPGDPEEDRFHGFFPWEDMKGYAAGKAITCAMMLKEKIKNFLRVWSDRKQREISFVLNLGIGWGTGILRTEGSFERTARSFAGEALRRSAGLASFARGGTVLAMKELVEKAENDHCSFHYGVLNKTADGEEKREGMYFRISDRQEVADIMMEDIREVASLAIAEIFPVREKE